MTIKSLAAESLRGNAPLMQQLYLLLKPSYVDPHPLLDRETKRNTDIYIAIDASSEIAAFFFVGWGYPKAFTETQIVYLGLSACREKYKGEAITVRLYRRFIHDALASEAGGCQRFLLWATTAHPLVFLVMHRLFANVNPSLAGAFSCSAAASARSLRRAIGGFVSDSENPFVLKSQAVGTLYSPEESARCELSRRKLDIDLLRTYDIQEKRGDRLLVTANLPDHTGKM